MWDFLRAADTLLYFEIAITSLLKSFLSFTLTEHSLHYLTLVRSQEKDARQLAKFTEYNPSGKKRNMQFFEFSQTLWFRIFPALSRHIHLRNGACNLTHAAVDLWPWGQTLQKADLQPLWQMTPEYFCWLS